MRDELSTCVLRTPRPEDAPSIARHANDRDVWLNLRDAFPHPYALEDAVGFLEYVGTCDPPLHAAIEVDGEAVGCIGLHPRSDVERVGAEIGYWLGRPYWGRGIMTEVVEAFSRDAMERLDLTRLFAVPFEWNRSSCRVLEKAGYTLEGVMRQAAIKDDRVVDQLLYARLRTPRSS